MFLPVAPLWDPYGISQGPFFAGPLRVKPKDKLRPDDLDPLDPQDPLDLCRSLICLVVNSDYITHDGSMVPVYMLT